jgi:glutamate N-acetyltransferase/amino-acid N-acetyltransferase
MTVTAPKGFRAAGVAAGLKSSGGADVAVVVNDGPDAAAAGVFTGNRVKAAPVLWSQQVVKGGVVRAVVLNSGGANACTGPRGFADTHATAEHAADLLDIGAGEVAVAGDGWSVGGMAKGAGMLAPALATMLVVLTTDAVAGADGLDAALRAATRVTFDRIDADGCMSTNDTVLLLASGASGVEPAYDELAAAVTAVCADLAQQLIADAEGATKHITIEVLGAATEDDAVEVGRAVARNNLVKTALFGNDPNWGRILAAVGTTRAAFEPDRVDVAVNGVRVCRAGAAAADRSTVVQGGRDVTITVQMHQGEAAATNWTTDLSHAYVHENSAYST